MTTLPRGWTKQKEGMYLNDVSKTDNNRLQILKDEGDSSKPIHKMDDYERSSNGYKIVLFTQDSREEIDSGIDTKEEAISEAYDYMDDNPASLGSSGSSSSSSSTSKSEMDQATLEVLERISENGNGYKSVSAINGRVESWALNREVDVAKTEESLGRLAQSGKIDSKKVAGNRKYKAVDDLKSGLVGSVRMVIRTERGISLEELQENVDADEGDVLKAAKKLKAHDLIMEDEPYHYIWLGEDTSAEEKEEQIQKAVQDAEEPAENVMGLKFRVAKPVHAREFYSSRYSSGLGDSFGKHRKDEPLYVPGEETSKGIQHTSDVQRVTATGDDVLFIKPQDEERSFEELEEALDKATGGIPTQRIYMYDGILGGEDNRVKALKTSPEQVVDPDTIVTLAEKKGYPASSRDDLAYIGEIPI